MDLQAIFQTAKDLGLKNKEAAEFIKERERAFAEEAERKAVLRKEEDERKAILREKEMAEAERIRSHELDRIRLQTQLQPPVVNNGCNGHLNTKVPNLAPVSYTHLRAHETPEHL